MVDEHPAPGAPIGVRLWLRYILSLVLCLPFVLGNAKTIRISREVVATICYTASCTDDCPYILRRTPFVFPYSLAGSESRPGFLSLELYKHEVCR